MNTPVMVAFALLVLAGFGVAGLRLVLEACERRRAVRWAHTLVRFCGDPSCPVCRSRSLSTRVPRIPAS